MNKYYIPNSNFVIKILEMSPSKALGSATTITKMIVIKHPKKDISVRNIKGYSEWSPSNGNNWNKAALAESKKIYEFEDDVSAILYSEVL